jgi:single-strand DNA-binding protein
VAWSNLAEICKQYLAKDRLVYIEGRLKTRHWEDTEGNKHSTTEIVANEMIMLDDRRESSNSASDMQDNEQEEFSL